MTKTSSLWLSRIGPEATATLERAMLLSRCGGTLVFLLVPVMWAFSALHSDLGLGLSAIACLVSGLAFFPWSQVLQIRARKQAAEFLGLSEREWTQIAVRSTTNFDRWAAQMRQHEF